MGVILVAGIIICTIQAIRTRQLLPAALWLAGVSAIVAILIYILGAPQVAVIELSVGAGLVTVLFVYAIGVAGEATRDLPSLIPKPLAWSLIILTIALLGWLIWPVHAASPVSAGPSFTDVLWEGRALDVWVQIVLVFSGVLGILGLLADRKTTEEKTLKRAVGEVPVPSQQLSREEAP
jgi:uncharacterized MnhB-related membrane protein